MQTHVVAASILVAAAFFAGGQTVPEPPAVQAIEAALHNVIDSIQKGDAQRTQNAFSAESRIYGIGGAAMSPIRQGAARLWTSQKTCSFYVRHVQLITNESAVAVGLWRCPNAAVPQDAGTLDVTLRREPDGWKVMSWRRSFAPAPRPMQPAAPAIIDGTDVLTAAERAEGWEALFDGKTPNGWMSASGEMRLPTGWRIIDGALATMAGAEVEQFGVMTQKSFTNFDLRFDWRVKENANSGCMYRLYVMDHVPRYPRPVAATGFEYQVADDNGDAGAKVDPRQRAGALYGVIGVEKSAAKSLGEWNESRTVVTRDHVEHWLNGVKTVSYPVDLPFASPIMLQHHFSEVRFRKIRIRELNGN